MLAPRALVVVFAALAATVAAAPAEVEARAVTCSTPTWGSCASYSPATTCRWKLTYHSLHLCRHLHNWLVLHLRLRTEPRLLLPEQMLVHRINVMRLDRRSHQYKSKCC